MSTLNIAFSGGIESTYLLQMGMEKGFDCHLVYINVGGDVSMCAGEILTMQKTLEYFRSNDLDKHAYPGTIKSVNYYFRRPHLNVVDYNTNRLITNDVTQQLSTIMGMSKFRQGMLKGRYPTTFIGWIKEDSSDHSLDENDFSSAEYEALLTLPITIGNLGNSDKLAKRFRAPLWNLSKKQIWDKLDSALKHCTIPNGRGRVHHENGKLIHQVFDNKLEEYKKAFIPCQDKYALDIPDTDVGFFVKRLLCCIDPREFGLPYSANRLIQAVLDEPILDERQPWLSESSLSSIREDLFRRVRHFYDASRLFSWPEEPNLKETASQADVIGES